MGLPVELTVNDTLVTWPEPDSPGRSASARSSTATGRPGFGTNKSLASLDSASHACNVDRRCDTRPRWQWQTAGGARLFGADGTEYVLVDPLERVEIERLLELDELDVVVVQCGSGIERWVGAKQAHSVWHDVEPDLDDVDDWRPPPGGPGARPYIAQLWRSAEGRHLILFNNE